MILVTLKIKAVLIKKASLTYFRKDKFWEKSSMVSVTITLHLA